MAICERFIFTLCLLLTGSTDDLGEVCVTIMCDISSLILTVVTVELQDYKIWNICQNRKLGVVINRGEVEEMVVLRVWVR